MKFITTEIGRLRLLGFLEGVSFLLLVFIGMPFKYWGDDPYLVKAIGPLHGVLFVLFVMLTLWISVARDWKFTRTTWKVLLASVLPFGTFYVDHTILRKMDPSD